MTVRSTVDAVVLAYGRTGGTGTPKAEASKSADGAACGIRTRDQPLTRRLLWPAELRRQFFEATVMVVSRISVQ